MARKNNIVDELNGLDIKENPDVTLEEAYEITVDGDEGCICLFDAVYNDIDDTITYNGNVYSIPVVEEYKEITEMVEEINNCVNLDDPRLDKIITKLTKTKINKALGV